MDNALETKSIGAAQTANGQVRLQARTPGAQCLAAQRTLLRRFVVRHIYRAREEAIFLKDRIWQTCPRKRELERRSLWVQAPMSQALSARMNGGRNAQRHATTSSRLPHLGDGVPT